MYKLLREPLKETEDALSQLLWIKYFISAISIESQVANVTVIGNSATKIFWEGAFIQIMYLRAV